ncbi:unnamed protein product [Caenorhabditis nigoni]
MSLLLKFIFLLLITHISTIDCWEMRSCDSNPSCKINVTVLSQHTARKFPKHCFTVCGRLLINGTNDLSAEQLTELFKNMRILVGGMRIMGTKFKNLRFLAGLRRFVTDPRLPGFLGDFGITRNPELRELGLLNLATIKTKMFYVDYNKNLEKLNLPKLEVAKCLGKNCTMHVQMNRLKPPNFCIKIQELDAFTRKRNQVYLDLNSNICIPKNAPKVCTVPTVGCQRLIGNLNITKGFDVRKVESLKRLYGTLYITNTDFTDFRFLGNLTHITLLGPWSDTEPALVVVGNKHLSNMEFPKLKRIDTEKLEFAHFADNSIASHADFKSCYAIRRASLPENDFDPQFGNRGCEQIEFPSTRWCFYNLAYWAPCSGSPQTL